MLWFQRILSDNIISDIVEPNIPDTIANMYKTEVFTWEIF
jgi:hypothetical protein